MAASKDLTEYKLVVVGGGGVGKSALTIQFIQVITLFVDGITMLVGDLLNSRVALFPGLSRVFFPVMIPFYSVSITVSVIVFSRGAKSCN